MNITIDIDTLRDIARLSPVVQDELEKALQEVRVMLTVKDVNGGMCQVATLESFRKLLE